MLKDQHALHYYNPNAHYLDSRGNLIEFLKSAANKLHLSKETLHIAVVYLDYVLSKQNFDNSILFLFAITCLDLAA